MLQALIIGLVQGGAFALLALGLVLVYQGSRVLNFAQAEIGTLSLFIAWVVSGEHHLPYVAGALAAVVTALLIGLVFERLVVWPMAEAPRLAVAVGTIGLLTLLYAAEIYFFGASPHYLAAPISGLGIQLAGVYVSPTQLLSVAIVVVAAAGLAAFLRWTDFGLGVRAAAEDPVAVRLVGVPLGRVSLFTWGAGAVLSAVAALLIEPTITVVAPGVIGEPLFIGGLAAALLGGLSSLTGALVGGVVVGVVTNEVLFLVPAGIPGLTSLVLFGIVLAVLVVRPQGLFGRLRARAETT